MSRVTMGGAGRSKGTRPRRTVAAGKAAERGRPAEPHRGWISASVDETVNAGRWFAPVLRAGDVVALIGPLGAGKTRLVTGIARGLGWSGDVRSPTFTLVNEYPAAGHTLLHADLYRLDPEEVDPLGFDEMLERAPLMVEWAEKLPPRLLEEALVIEMEVVGEHERRITASAEGGRGLELRAAWDAAVSRETSRDATGEERP